MGAKRLLGAFLAIGGVPLVALGGLIVHADIAVWPGGVTFAATALSALAVAYIWLRDIDLLAETLRQAMANQGPALSSAAAAPRIPSVERIAHGIEQLARGLANRAGEIGVLLRANQAIIERLPDPLLVLAPDRAVLRANTAMRTAFRDEIPVLLRHPVLRSAITSAWTEKATQTVDLSLPVPVEREVQATIIYFDPPLADGGQALVILSDRTRERRVEAMRADFVANVSHELRTPLASVIGFIDTIRGPAADDPPAQVRFLGIMAEQADRMRRLIDDLLSLSRIELVEHELPSTRIDVAELVRGVAASFEPRLAERRTSLILDLAPGLPTVPADADQIAQVASNLIENAIKYGREAGQVTVSVSAARAGVVLVVSDDGPGMARVHLPRLTERFYRVDKARSRNAGGTGLGLAIVKHITNRHRGQLQIESEEGKGSRFSVWLPIGKVDG